MTTLVAILLYLNFLQPLPIVSELQVITLEQQHEAEIVRVESDPGQMMIVEREWMDDASRIVVVNDFEQE